MMLAIGEGISALGIGSSAVTMVPAFLVTGAISLPLVVPATCRLFLTMACDLILVLVRSFKEVTFRDSGQPTEKDVATAARNYRIRGYSEHVHADVKKLIPRRSLSASYKCEKIRVGVETIVERYKDELAGDGDIPLQTKRSRVENGDSVRPSLSNNVNSFANTLQDDDSWTEDGNMLFRELSDAHKRAIELEAWTPASKLSPAPGAAELYGDEKMKALHEMDAGVQVHEMDPYSEAVDVDAKRSFAKVHELEG